MGLARCFRFEVLMAVYFFAVRESILSDRDFTLSNSIALSRQTPSLTL